MNITAFSKSTTTISAVVTRADGTVEDLGIISYKDSNPFKTFGWYLVHPEQWRHKCQKFAKYLWSKLA